MKRVGVGAREGFIYGVPAWVGRDGHRAGNKLAEVEHRMHLPCLSLGWT
jgi:hypothetical protein